MYPDPHKPVTKAEATAMLINTFAVGFLIAFVLWLALDWSEIQNITTVEANWDEIRIGIQNACPGGLLAVLSMWIYHSFLKD